MMSKHDLWLSVASREGEPFLLEHKGKVFLYKLIKKRLIGHNYVPDATYHVWDLRGDHQKWLSYPDYIPAYKEYARRTEEDR